MAQDTNKDTLFRNYKSSGVRLYPITSSYYDAKIPQQIFYGIKTPIIYGSVEGVFAMNDNLIDQVADNFKNLILTNHGERVGEYFLGANLKPLLSEFSNLNDFDGEAISRISNATNKYMPYIQIVDYKSTYQKLHGESVGIVTITIYYSIPKLNVKNKSLELSLYVM